MRESSIPVRALWGLTDGRLRVPLHQKGQISASLPDGLDRGLSAVVRLAELFRQFAARGRQGNLGVVEELHDLGHTP